MVLIDAAGYVCPESVKCDQCVLRHWEISQALSPAVTLYIMIMIFHCVASKTHFTLLGERVKFTQRLAQLTT